MSKLQHFQRNPRGWNISNGRRWDDVVCRKWQYVIIIEDNSTSECHVSNQTIMNMSCRKKNFRSLSEEGYSGRRIECVIIVFEQNFDGVVYQNHSVLGYNNVVCFYGHAIYYVPWCIMLYSHIYFMFSYSYNYEFHFIRKFFWKNGRNVT